MNKTICLVGGDVAPTNCFNVLEAMLRIQYPGLKIINLSSGGKQADIEELGLQASILHSDVVVLGLSSSPLRAESEVIAADLALEAGIPYGYYSDMALCPFRPWLTDLAKDASFLVGLLPTDVAELSSMYPKADIYNTGNPFRGSMSSPRFTREEVREKLGIKPHEKLIIAPGSKFTAGNFQIWGLVLETLQHSEFCDDVVVMFTPHPGDSTLRAVDFATKQSLSIYEDMFNETRVQTRFGGMETADVVAGADVVIDFTGDISVRACYQRIPLINITTELLLSRFEKETTSRSIETVENGSGLHLEVFSENYLLHALQDVFDPSSEVSLSLRKAQETAYPIPGTVDASLNALVSAIAIQLRL